MKDKFVIVDGSSMLSTCYYAVLPREIMFAKTEEEKQKHYAKARVEKLGLVNVSVYKADRETINELATAKGVTVSDIVQELVKSYVTADTATTAKTTKKEKQKA